MGGNVNSIWTEDRITDLRRLWDEGYSCSQIASVMNCGLTRNAIIGKVRRLGLSERVWGNGYSRIVNPTPLVDKPPRPARRPRFERLPKPPKILNVVSPLTGALISKIITRRPREPERTKTELRAMLTNAVQNTAAMEAT